MHKFWGGSASRSLDWILLPTVPPLWKRISKMVDLNGLPVLKVSEYIISKHFASVSSGIKCTVIGMEK